MYTEIKEFCNFLVRYLRYRIPCQTLKDYIEHFANLLLLELELDWNKRDATGQSRVHILHWCVNGTTSDIFFKAVNQSGMNPDYLKVLLPEKLIVAISSGLVTYHSNDDAVPRPIWEGDPNEDLDYDPSPLCAKVVYEPPCVTISKNRNGNILCGKPLFGEENFSDSTPAYLTDPMMNEGQFVMLLTKPMKNSFEFSYLNNFEGKVFKVERFVSPRQVPDYGLIPISQFHNTRFGSFRTNLATPPRILEADEEVRVTVNTEKSPPNTPPRPSPTLTTALQVQLSSPLSSADSSPSSSTHSSTQISPIGFESRFDMGPTMQVPVKLLRELLTPEQKRVLRMLNYPCD